MHMSLRKQVQKAQLMPRQHRKAVQVCCLLKLHDTPIACACNDDEGAVMQDQALQALSIMEWNACTVQTSQAFVPRWALWSGVNNASVRQLLTIFIVNQSV